MRPQHTSAYVNILWVSSSIAPTVRPAPQHTSAYVRTEYLIIRYHSMGGLVYHSDRGSSSSYVSMSQDTLVFYGRVRLMISPPWWGRLASFFTLRSCLFSYSAANKQHPQRTRAYYTVVDMVVTRFFGGRCAQAQSKHQFFQRFFTGPA
jgi:hypothetical protein